MKHVSNLASELRVFPGRDLELEEALKAFGLNPASVGRIDPNLRGRLLHLATAWPASFSSQTMSARRTDMRRFVAWCRDGERYPFACEDDLCDLIEACLVAMSTKIGPSSLRRLGASLGVLLSGLGQADTLLKERRRLLMRALNRKACERQTGRPTHRRLDLAELEAIEAVILEGRVSLPKKQRDLAMVVLMCELMLRRNELLGFRLSDWDVHQRRIVIRKSKTDQEGRGVVHDLSPRAASILEDWASALREIAQASGACSHEALAQLPLFVPLRKNGTLRLGRDREVKSMDGRSVSRLLDGYARQVGIEGVSGHTPRRSVARLMHEAGCSDEDICEAGRWASVEVMRGYVGLRPSRQSAGGVLAGLGKGRDREIQSA